MDFRSSVIWLRDTFPSSSIKRVTTASNVVGGILFIIALAFVFFSFSRLGSIPENSVKYVFGVIIVCALVGTYLLTDQFSGPFAVSVFGIPIHIGRDNPQSGEKSDSEESGVRLSGEDLKDIQAALEQSSRDPLEETIAQVERQIALKNYRSGTTESGMKIVEYRNNWIRVRSDNTGPLKRGLLFNVFVRDTKVGVAEITETESTSGLIFELEFIDWNWAGKERQQFEVWMNEGDGEVQIITEIEVDLELQELEQARDCLMHMQNEQEIIYEP